MARKPRLIAPGLPIHVTHRGHNHDSTFLDEHDFAFYRECLRESSQRYACTVHAYALMTNHIHILMTPGHAGSAPGLMRSLGSRYVRYWNRRHHRSGTLWDGRFHSVIVGDDRQFLRCSKYIDLNPVKAGMVSHPTEYEWSSYRALALGAPDAMVSPHALYAALDGIGPARPDTYAAYCTTEHDEQWLLEFRRATRNNTAVGSRDALDSLEARLGCAVRRSTHGGARRRHRADAPLPTTDERASAT